MLAARQITTFMFGDNYTWPKPGGLSSNRSIRDCLHDAVDSWHAWAIAQERRYAGTIKSGSLRVLRGNCISTRCSNHGAHYDAIVNSPPYANRLDYTQLWAPELAVLQAISPLDRKELKREMIGTTIVRNNRLDERAIGYLPARTRRELTLIREDPTPFSDSYYFHFFLRYLVTLRDALERAAGQLVNDGVMLIFVRDTVRKDTVLSIGHFVREVLRYRAGMRLRRPNGCHQEIVRAHIGLRRSKRARGLHGTAQREWWLAFERRTNAS